MQDFSISAELRVDGRYLVASYHASWLTSDINRRRAAELLLALRRLELPQFARAVRHELKNRGTGDRKSPAGGDRPAART